MMEAFGYAFSFAMITLVLSLIVLWRSKCSTRQIEDFSFGLAFGTGFVDFALLLALSRLGVTVVPKIALATVVSVGLVFVLKWYHCREIFHECKCAADWTAGHEEANRLKVGQYWLVGVSIAVALAGAVLLQHFRIFTQ